MLYTTPSTFQLLIPWEGWRGTRKWEEAHLGQLTQTGQRDTPHHETSYSIYKLEVKWARATAGDWLGISPSYLLALPSCKSVCVSSWEIQQQTRCTSCMVCVCWGHRAAWKQHSLCADPPCWAERAARSLLWLLWAYRVGCDGWMLGNDRCIWEECIQERMHPGWPCAAATCSSSFAKLGLGAGLYCKAHSNALAGSVIQNITTYNSSAQLATHKGPFKPIKLLD